MALKLESRVRLMLSGLEDMITFEAGERPGTSKTYPGYRIDIPADVIFIDRDGPKNKQALDLINAAMAKHGFVVADPSDFRVLTKGSQFAHIGIDKRSTGQMMGEDNLDQIDKEIAFQDSIENGVGSVTVVATSFTKLSEKFSDIFLTAIQDAKAIDLGRHGRQLG